MKLRHYSPIHFGAQLFRVIGGGGQSAAIAQPPSGGGLNQKLLRDLVRLRPIRRRLPRAFVTHQSRVGAVVQVRIPLLVACVQSAIVWCALPWLRTPLTALFVGQLSRTHAALPAIRFRPSLSYVIADDDVVDALNLWHQRAAQDARPHFKIAMPISSPQDQPPGRVRVGSPSAITDEEAVAAVILWRLKNR